MAAPRRRSRHSLIERLFREPHRFSFFQAVRLLEGAARRDAANPRYAARAPVGEDAEPQAEAVRFRTAQNLVFQANEISDLKPGEAAADGRRPAGPPTLTVTFMGLTGPSGVLPYHYTETVIRNLRARSFSLRDFLDLLNHRAIALFHRAWQKYRLVPSYERQPPGGDAITQGLFALVGLGLPPLRNRLAVDDVLALHYGGYLARLPRTAVGLERMLSDLLGQLVRVEQFKGRWMFLAVEEQSRLPSRDEPDGQFCQLGVNSVAGERVWDVQGSFRLHVGPLGPGQLRRFMPAGGELARLAQMTRLYVGPDLTFDLQLTLRRDAVPDLRLSDDEAEGPRLGWNTWVKQGPIRHDVEPSVFQLSDL